MAMVCARSRAPLSRRDCTAQRPTDVAVWLRLQVRVAGCEAASSPPSRFRRKPLAVLGARLHRANRCMCSVQKSNNRDEVPDPPAAVVLVVGAVLAAGLAGAAAVALCMAAGIAVSVGGHHVHGAVRISACTADATGAAVGWGEVANCLIGMPARYHARPTAPFAPP